MNCAKIIIGIALSTLCLGCASIFGDSEYVQKFEASVTNVVMDIEKNGAPYQADVPVPAEIKLPADNGFFSRATYSFTFKKEGFKNKTLTRRAKVDPLYWVNFVTGYGCVLGMLIVDPWTGAMWSLEETPLVAVLEKADDVVLTNSVTVATRPLEIENNVEARPVAEPVAPIGNMDQKCPQCGVERDAKGKCPLCGR